MSMNCSTAELLAEERVISFLPITYRVFNTVQTIVAFCFAGPILNSKS
jgi:hypothetical protein